MFATFIKYVSVLTMPDDVTVSDGHESILRLVGNDAIEAGNPDIRVPKNLTIEDGQRAWRAEEGEAAEAGNPDIRAPESLKREDGQRTRRAEEEKDAERRDVERSEEGNIGEDEKELDSFIEEGGPLTS
ncbi:hypothetical protein NDU88_005874 [Pleurodeles waltl]|uniref:Uncharacterized protein n=1 Tax=Pleurodeles waltl TaxID=8319 RepID=A0AAV7VMI4_PLEWA|nr:hypothetical protein NDU88_005874 [Pleurodeles waltl]